MLMDKKTQYCWNFFLTSIKPANPKQNSSKCDVDIVILLIFSFTRSGIC